ncbi:MAG: hypothetical protein H8E36_15550 [Rhodospirillaceae bacterium]|nr:hypothetical protein [Rhodospirillaceae bacterium]MBL6931725.1 hypothetical protein [Rhodospirillales bacterium]
MTISNRPAPPPPSFITIADEIESKAPSRPLPTYQADASPINVEKIDRNINESLRKQILDIINKNPDFALSVIRGWKDRRD